MWVQFVSYPPPIQIKPPPSYHSQGDCPHLHEHDIPCARRSFHSSFGRCFVSRLVFQNMQWTTRRQGAAEVWEEKTFVPRRKHLAQCTCFLYTDFCVVKCVRVLTPDEKGSLRRRSLIGSSTRAASIVKAP